MSSRDSPNAPAAPATNPEEQKLLVQLVTELEEHFPDKEQVAANLRYWMQEAHEGAYAKNTLLAWRGDCRRFAKFCRRHGRKALPADVPTILDFLQTLLHQKKCLATVRRTLSTLSLLHTAARVPNPCDDVFVKLRMKKMARTLSRRQKQARGLVWEEIEKYLALPAVVARDYRDRALVLLAYDTKFRSEEVVGVDVEHLKFDTDGSGTVELQKSKTDQEGEGAVLYLAPDTVAAIHEWMKRAQITSGALFRPIQGKHKIKEDRMRPPAVASVFQRIGRKIGLPSEDIERLTGHATRVGSTQDQLAHNQEVGVIMQSGRWQDTRMVMRYGARLLAKRSGMAKLAKLQGRVKRIPTAPGIKP